MTALEASFVAALLREFGQRSALAAATLSAAKPMRARPTLCLRSVFRLTASSRRTAFRRFRVSATRSDIVKKLHATGTHPALEKMRKVGRAGHADHSRFAS
jgi:DNA polymerase (family 10)